MLVGNVQEDRGRRLVFSQRRQRFAVFEVPSSGTLLYVPGPTSSVGPHWMDRAGKTTPMGATLPMWFNPQFAPDGRRLAMNIVDGQNDV